MKRPWMPLYVADYLADTQHLTAAESGAYLHLIMHYWLNDSLPTVDSRLARIARMTDKEWAAARSTIAEFFSDGWKHGRIESELTDAVRLSNAGRTGGVASGQARKQRSTNDRSTTSKRSFNGTSNDPSTKPQALHSLTSSTCLDSENPITTQARCTDSPSSDGERWDFEVFWDKYPRKIGRKTCQEKFNKIRLAKLTTFEKIMAGVAGYIAGKDADKEFCYPITWLNQGRWDDEFGATGAAPQAPRANGTPAAFVPPPPPPQRFAKPANQRPAPSKLPPKIILDYATIQPVDWLRHIRAWAGNGGPWPAEIGPPPTDDACIAPQDILDQVDRELKAGTLRQGPIGKPLAPPVAAPALVPDNESFEPEPMDLS
jgi:uncharacterized protein YdaU (DUF1376 family)